MKLSIVIPTKNEQAFLPKLIESIKEQSFSDYEIIVADAGSVDETRNIAASSGARIVNGGLPGVGRNRGAEVAQGEIIVFFDADVVLPYHGFLANCISEMLEKHLDVATCRVKAIEGTLTDDIFHEIYNLYTTAVENFWPHAPGFCMFAMRDAHAKLGGFDESVVFAEDQDYVMRAKRAGLSFGIMRGEIVTVSVRRLDKEGRIKFALKYLYAEWLIRTQGSIRKEKFKYEFGKFLQEKSKESQTKTLSKNE